MHVLHCKVLFLLRVGVLRQLVVVGGFWLHWTALDFEVKTELL
jgi:hypothetical protein